MKTVLITGGAGRIGRATALRLVSEGWRVVLGDVDLDGLREAEQALAEPDQVIAAALDVTRLDDLRATVDALVQKHGPFAALVNAAGGRRGAETGPFVESDPQQWRAVINLHLRSVIGCCYAVLPGMIEAGAGSIVSIAAFEGLRGAAGSAVFSAAKAGVIVLTETLVAECQKFGVRVNAVVPVPPQAAAQNGVDDDSSHVAEMVAFLLSDRSALTSGACLDVSAGWALH